MSFTPRDEAEETMTRFEPGNLSGRAVPLDPYAAWLQERDDERADTERVRWVYRPHSVSTAA
jgi:hypothetical protein